jgi:hypothetical protein
LVAGLRVGPGNPTHTPSPPLCPAFRVSPPLCLAVGVSPPPCLAFRVTSTARPRAWRCDSRLRRGRCDLPRRRRWRRGARRLCRARSCPPESGSIGWKNCQGEGSAAIASVQRGVAQLKGLARTAPDSRGRLTCQIAHLVVPAHAPPPHLADGSHFKHKCAPSTPPSLPMGTLSRLLERVLHRQETTSVLYERLRAGNENQRSNRKQQSRRKQRGEEDSKLSETGHGYSGACYPPSQCDAWTYLSVQPATPM